MQYQLYGLIYVWVTGGHGQKIAYSKIKMAAKAPIFDGFEKKFTCI